MPWDAAPHAPPTTTRARHCRPPSVRPPPGRRWPDLADSRLSSGLVPRPESPYDWSYQRERRALLDQGRRCQLRLACSGVRANSADHDPPLALHDHVKGSNCCRLVPACLDCQRVQGKEVARQLRLAALPHAPVPSRRW